MRDYPHDIPVSTSIGEILVTITQDDHAFILGKECFVKGKNLYFTLHLYRKGSTWNINNRHDISVKKNGTVGWKENATDKQEQTVLACIVPLMNNWLENHKELKREAQTTHIATKITNLVDKKKEYQQQIDMLDIEIARLQKSSTLTHNL